MSTLKDQGNDEFKAKNFEKAIELFTQALEEAPQDHHLIYGNRSVAYLRLNQLENAIDDGDKCIKIKPNWSKGYQRKGNALHAIGRKEEALACYEKGFDVDPTNTMLIKELSGLKVEIENEQNQKKHEEASMMDQLNQVIEFLAKGNFDQKSQAIDIIMSYSATVEQRLVFQKTDVIKELQRTLFVIGQDESDPKVRTAMMECRLKALKALINFSQDEQFLKQMCSLNIVRRIYDILKENVRQDLKNAELMDGQTNKATLNTQAGVFEVKQTDSQLEINKATGDLQEKKVDFQEETIEHSFMLLSNITAIEHGQQHVLGLEADTQLAPLSEGQKKQMQFIISESIFGMFCYFNKNTSFDFVSNVMANLACQSEGRTYMVDNKYIESIVSQMVKNNLNAHRRKYLISCLRNLLFDCITYEQTFFDMGVPKDICKALIDEQGFRTKLPESWPKTLQAKADKEEAEVDWNNTVQIIECIFLLCKSPILLEKMRELKVHELLLEVKVPKEQQYVDVNCRIDELILQFAMPEAGDMAAQDGSGQMMASSGREIENDID